MASINKSADSSDRATGGGKGDQPRGSHEHFRKARFWWRSLCCNAPVADVADLGPDGEGHACKDCECFTHIKE